MEYNDTFTKLTQRSPKKENPMKRQTLDTYIDLITEIRNWDRKWAAYFSPKKKDVNIAPPTANDFVEELNKKYKIVKLT